MIMRSIKKSVAVAVLAGIIMTMFIAVVPMLVSAAQDYGIENVQLYALESWSADDLAKIASTNATLSFDIGRKPSVTSGTTKFAPTKSLLITAAEDGDVAFSNFDAEGSAVVPEFTNRYDESAKSFSIASPGTGTFEGICLWVNTNMLGADAADCWLEIALSDGDKKAVMKDAATTGALGGVADGGDYMYFKFADFNVDGGFDPLAFSKIEITLHGTKAGMQLLISDFRLFNFTESYLETMAAVNALYGAEEYDADAYEEFTSAYEAYVKETLNGKKSSVNTKKAALDAAIAKLGEPQLKLYDIKGFRAYKTEDIDEMYEQLYCNASLITNNQKDYVYDYDDVDDVYSLEYNSSTKTWERVAGPNASLKLLKLVCTEVEGWMEFMNYDREEKMEDGQPIPINDDFFGKDMSGYTGLRFYMNFSNIPESRAKSVDVIIGTYGEEPNQIFTARIDEIKESGYYLVPFSSFDNQDLLPEYMDKLDTFGLKFNDITNGVEVAITDVKAYIIVNTESQKAKLVNLIDEIENEYEESFWSRQSWAKLIDEKNAALKVAGKENVSQAEIDAEYEKLQAAVDNLKKPQYALLRFPGFGSWTEDQLKKMVNNGGTFSITRDQAYLAKDEEGNDVTDAGLLVEYKSGAIQLYSYSNANSGESAEYKRLEAVTTPFGGRNATGYDGIRVYLYMPKGGAPTRMTMTIGNCNAFMPVLTASCTVDTSDMKESGYVYFPFNSFRLSNNNYSLDYEFLDYFAINIQGSYLVQEAFYCLSDIAAYKILDDEGNPLDGDLPGSEAPVSLLPVVAVSLLAFAVCMVAMTKKASRAKRSGR
ncbi:MAG: hypothetical protein J5756_05850 [Clostridia bacterium]|nr:hypothetical protein [Clostridia bacterium]